MTRWVALVKLRSVQVALCVSLVAALVGLGLRAAEAPAAGPWILKRAFVPPPYDDTQLRAMCEQAGREYLNRYPGAYIDYSCNRDAPFYWRLWLQTR